MIRSLSSLRTLPPSGRRRAPVGRRTGRGRIGAGGAPARRPLVVPLVGDLDADRRTLRSELVDRMRPDGLLVIDLRRVAFLDAGTTRRLLDLRGRTVGSDVRMVLWRAQGQPLRILHGARLDRLFDLQPRSWHPQPPR